MLWGDGSPTREFLYVEDAAEGILLAAERYDSSEPVNLGNGEEISIRDLAAQVAEATGYEGASSGTPASPTGSRADGWTSRRARRVVGFVARTPFAEGLRATVAWFEGEIPRRGARR